MTVIELEDVLSNLPSNMKVIVGDEELKQVKNLTMHQLRFDEDSDDIWWSKHNECGLDEEIISSEEVVLLDYADNEMEEENE